MLFYNLFYEVINLFFNQRSVFQLCGTTFWGFVSGGVKDALTFGLRLMFVDITEP